MSSKRAQSVALYLIEVVLLILVSTLAGQLGLIFGFEQGNVSLVWPQTGIVFAILLRYGRRLWVGALIGALLTNLLNQTTPLIALMDATTSTLSALLAIELLYRVDFHPSLRRVRDVIAFVCAAMILSPLINASVGVLGMMLEGVVRPGSELRVWLTWWLGDGMGVLIVAPVILSWSERPFKLLPRRQFVEITVMFALFAVVAWLIFDKSVTRMGFSPLAYLIFPFLVWTALRYSHRTVVTLTLFASIIAILGTMLQVSRISREIVWNNLLFLWAYLATLSITALLLWATLSERREIENSLSSLEERFSKAFHSAALAIGITTLEEGRFVEVNDKYSQLMGYSRDELIGHTPMELGIWYDPNLRPHFVEKLRRGESVIEVETRARAKSGEIRHGLMSMEPIELDGEPHLLGMFQDVTDRLQAQEALRDSEQRYRQLFEGIEDMIIVHDLKGRILDVNESACRHLGYSRDEFLRMNVVDLDSPTFAAGFAKRMQERLEHGQLHEVEGELVTKHGQVLTVDVSSKLITYKGQVVVLAVDRDITQRKLIEEKLRKSEARYRAVVEDQTEFIARIAPDWQIKFVNEAFCRYYGKTREELIDSYFKPHVHEDDFQLVRTMLKALGKDIPVVTYEHRVILENGEVRWQQWTDRAFVDDDGTVNEYQFVGKDITELKRMENERMVAALEHEKVQILADFIAAASHDFRTPLSVINTSAYLLNRVSDPEQRERHFQTIQAQIHNVERLVDGLLMMSRLDRGDVFNFAPVDMNTVVRQLEVQKRPQIDRKHLKLTLDLSPNLPPVVGDDEWLYRALYRLVENAIQFTSEGGAITITSGVTADEVFLDIRDTGSGISPDDLPHIFERLYRGDNHRPIGGQGLGLSIAKKIVEGHDGSIEVESTPDMGTTFRVLLPVMAETSPDASADVTDAADTMPADSSAETSPSP